MRSIYPWERRSDAPEPRKLLVSWRLDRLCFPDPGLDVCVEIFMGVIHRAVHERHQGGEGLDSSHLRNLHSRDIRRFDLLHEISIAHFRAHPRLHIYPAPVVRRYQPSRESGGPLHRSEDRQVLLHDDFGWVVWVRSAVVDILPRCNHALVIV
ncbi:hypothetical protein BDV98DRAFT_559545 [Pterulicium gracile]|uniref:Uncharacterized protein n=1 Tax=Pterulicium gracile TaxID=1884261 RepID=A0A5C3QWY8_9AGAR|nr:hypothetical protein BDV98DRAFT_559545 [Pterula gracilis]